MNMMFEKLVLTYLVLIALLCSALIPSTFHVKSKHTILLGAAPKNIIKGSLPDLSQKSFPDLPEEGYYDLIVIGRYVFC